MRAKRARYAARWPARLHAIKKEKTDFDKLIEAVKEKQKEDGGDKKADAPKPPSPPKPATP